MKYIDHDIPFELKNAKYIDRSGLFVGNQHFSMDEAIEEIAHALEY